MNRIFTGFPPLLLLVLLSAAISKSCYSQSEASPELVNNPSHPVEFNPGADLVSRYIWRGRDYGSSPAIQPNVSVSFFGIKIGVWGSYGFVYHPVTGNYSEVDPFVSYTWKWFTVGLTNYFFPNGQTANENNNYFNYKSETTGHTFEGSLTFTGGSKFPLTVFAGTLFYGADKGTHTGGTFEPDTTLSHNNYSTYVEVSWPFTLRKIGIKVFAGGIPFGSGWYGPYGGVVNTGATVSKSIRFTDKFELPVYTSVIANPQAQNFFLVFGMTF